MKKSRKSRAVSALISTFYGVATEDGTYSTYYLVAPYDKKGREIPSSVTCCYNSEYYSEQDVASMVQAL